MSHVAVKDYWKSIGSIELWLLDTGKFEDFQYVKNQKEARGAKMKVVGWNQQQVISQDVTIYGDYF